MSSVASEQLPDAAGRFGPYGGRYVPETLVHPLRELEEEYFRAQQDPEFQRELDYYLREFVGRPTPLYHAQRLTEDLGGAKIYLKREDLLHTGAHKNATRALSSYHHAHTMKLNSKKQFSISPKSCQ